MSASDWEKLVRRLEAKLRLKSFPVALKLLENSSKLDEIPFLRRPESPKTLCQLLNLARNFDWTVGAELQDFAISSCSSILGFEALPESHRDGTFRSIVWSATKADARRFEAAIPRLPLGRWQAVALAPLVYEPFEPDLVLIYANPAQMILLINALQFTDYEVFKFYCVGESSCADAIVRGLLSGKPSLALPCYGERCYGHTQDDELVMALPPAFLARAVTALEALYRRGVRYPISFAGATADATGLLPPLYLGLAEMKERLRGAEGRHLLLGVTGGIAGGKSTVSKMLAELGAPLIDFDELARRVVEPGTEGYRQIVDYFGRQVLAADGTLDRKKLSDIVFGDLEKRKKLESFTHPPIYEEFYREIAAITARDPAAIIQVAVPLLVELNLQFLFDRILVVEVPVETQLERLQARDGIDREAAERIIAAQLPIADKLPFADFIVDNSRDLTATRRQVEKIWFQLKQSLERLSSGEERVEERDES
jgi:dephospho-CoA kinase